MKKACSKEKKKKMHSCVEQVKDQDKSEDSAYAICTDSIEKAWNEFKKIKDEAGNETDLPSHDNHPERTPDMYYINDAPEKSPSKDGFGFASPYSPSAYHIRIPDEMRWRNNLKDVKRIQDEILDEYRIRYDDDDEEGQEQAFDTYFEEHNIDANCPVCEDGMMSAAPKGNKYYGKELFCPNCGYRNKAHEGTPGARTKNPLARTTVPESVMKPKNASMLKSWNEFKKWNDEKHNWMDKESKEMADEDRKKKKKAKKKI